VGAVPNDVGAIRVGLRTRRGLKGAVVRNRLKRQLRVLVADASFDAPAGHDVVIVIHPPQLRAPIRDFADELLRLCRQLQAARRPSSSFRSSI
jgi:ribonuclease P protein component